MTTPANRLISDDPYATAVRLLQVGANLTMHQAGELISNRQYDQVVAFAAQADSDSTAAEVIGRLIDTGMDELSRLGIDYIVSDLFWRHGRVESR